MLINFCLKRFKIYCFKIRIVMKILWVNPSFLDYRVPVYKKLNELTNGNFFLIYSTKRVPERVIRKITKEIGANAIGLRNEAILRIPGTAEFEESNVRLPYQPGLYKAVSGIDADIIIGEGFFQWTPVALLRAKMTGKKFLLAYERTSHTERSTPKWRTFYRRVISRFVDGYSVNGKLTKEYLSDIGIEKHLIFQGGMSADSENLIKDLRSYTPFDRAILKDALSIESGLTFLYVGQIIQRKGVIYLLNAWKRHLVTFPKDNLLIVGTGPLYEDYKMEFSNFESIKLLGAVDYDLIYKYYAISDVFIIPTLEDNWSLVVPEAMACGLPIACSIYNGCYPELVQEDRNGKLFDPLNEESILDCLKYFHNSNLQMMGEESIKIESDFDAEQVSRKIYSSAECLLGNVPRLVSNQ